MDIFESLSWLWLLIGIVGAIAVIIGVFGEEKAERKNWPYRKKEFWKTFFWIVLIAGLSFDLIGLIGSDITSDALKNRVSVLNARAKANEVQVLLLQTNLASLNNTTLELAHEYDLSTNALAEAKLRISEASNSVAEAEQFAKEAADASQKAQQIEAKLPKSRLLTAFQEHELTNLLFSVKPMTYSIEIESGDDEPKMLAGEIGWVFFNANFKEDGGWTYFGSPAGTFGVKIFLKDVPDDNFAFALRQLFRMISQKPDVTLDPNQSEGMIIKVFPKYPN
jgi:hypothetical protein